MDGWLYDWAGKPARYDLINRLIADRGYTKYLEIGCRDNRCFDAVRCQTKVGVDPSKGGTLRLTSDEFFERLDSCAQLGMSVTEFDVVFIDGDHRCEQVLRDVENSLRYLTPGGAIVMHDCLPVAEEHQVREYRGGICNQDAWKACVLLRTRSDVRLAVGTFDCGVGLIHRVANPSPLALDFELTPENMIEALTWRMYVDGHAGWLEPLSFDALVEWSRDVL